MYILYEILGTGEYEDEGGEKWWVWGVWECRV